MSSPSRLRRALRWWPQLLRRGLQLGVVAFIAWAALNGIWRNYKVAHNSARLVTLMAGDTWGTLYDLNEKTLEHWDEPMAASLDFVGMPWASTVAGLPGADPILVASYVVSTGEVSLSLLVGLLVPLIVALLLGKFFCSHLCPARLMFEVGQLIRSGLLRLGLPLPNLRHPDRYGGWILLGGLVGAALSSTAIWFAVLPYVGLSAGLFLAITTGTTAGLLIIPLGWLALDTLVAPGYFCHNLCPQGFLLEQLGRLAPLKLRVKKDAEPCPDSCNVCEAACPYTLSPRELTHTPACDNCGLCVAPCPRDRLVRRFGMPITLFFGALLVGLLPAPSAEAHHNKGLPHYGYYENYPQVPTEEHITVQGDWEMGTTIFNFQGYAARDDASTPNDVKFYIYIYDLKRDANHLGAATFEISIDDEVVSRFHREKVDEEWVYSTRETVPRSGEYLLTAYLGPEGTVREPTISMPFYIELHDDAIDWVFLGLLALPLLPLFVLALLGRGRRGRIRNLRDKSKSLKAGSAGVGSAAVISAAVIPTAVIPTAVIPTMGLLLAAVWPAVARAQEAPRHGPDMTLYPTESGDVVMVMGGIPGWLFVLGAVLIIALSFVVVERIGVEPKRGFRVNILRNRRLYALVQSRWFQAVPQLVMVGLFAFLIYAGLAGSRVRNVTPVAVWTVWWAGLIFAIALLGPVWCFVCPWDGLANLLSRFRLARKVEPLSLNLDVPEWAQNVYPAIGLFALLSWAELGLGITSDPRQTAYLGLGVVVLATLGVLAFKGKAFCRYACPVGRINGIYGNFAPVEVRPYKIGACHTCETKDCLTGNERGYGCPTGLLLENVQDANYCTFCTECVKTCPRQNVAFNIRPFGADLQRIANPRMDEAWLCLSLLSLTLFHGFSMTTVWEDFAPGSVSVLKWMALTFGTGHAVNFTIAMVVACAAPIVLYRLSCSLAARLTRGSGVSARDIFVRYSYSLLPVAMFYHLAHNAMHFLMEGHSIVPLLSDPLGRGQDWFGTAELHLEPLMSDQTLWVLQVGLIIVGHLFGVVVAHRMSRQLFKDAGQATRSLLPMLAVMLVVSIAGLSLMVLDMNMRAGRM